MGAPHAIDEIAPRRAPVEDISDSEARRARLVLALIPLLTIGAIGGSRLWFNMNRAEIAARAGKEIANRTGASVRIGELSAGAFFQPCMHQVAVYRKRGNMELSATSESACVDRWASAIGSGFRAVQVRLDRPSIVISGSDSGRDKQALVDIEPKKLDKGSASLVAPKRPDLQEVELVFENLTLDWKGLPLPERFASGSLGPINGSFTVQRRGLASAVSITISEPKSGLSAAGRATPTEDGWDLSLRVQGDLEPSFGRFLSWAGLDIRKLPTRGDIGVIYSASGGTLTLDLDLEQYDADLANEMVSSRRLVGFSARQKARLLVDLRSGRLTVEDAALEVNGIPSEVSLDIQTGEGSPRFSFEFALKTIPIAKLMSSIPGAQVPPNLENLPPNILFALTFGMRGELRDAKTWEPRLDRRVIGVEGVAGSGLEFLRTSFDYWPLRETDRATTPLRTGPETSKWVRYANLPYIQRRAIQVSEDANFFLHDGIDIEEIRNAIEDGLTSGKRTRGGSTLTQQLVKNLFLSRDRTAQRKVQELVLTYLIEAALTKEEIFETYANVIEWGPSIYGLTDAAWYYFGKSPRGLTVKEMCYLTSIIPGPILFHKYFESGYVPGAHLSKITTLIERLHKITAIDDDTYLAALDEPLRFARAGRTRVVEPQAQAPEEAPAPTEAPDPPSAPPKEPIKIEQPLP
ncbi:MAG: transglycosylase domain-containing protein [Deltaproteobacteria bacterium]|nr:transglycosylase domain-containing protein [Deltaproteobacteria bacterium]